MPETVPVSGEEPRGDRFMASAAEASFPAVTATEVVTAFSRESALLT